MSGASFKPYPFAPTKQTAKKYKIFGFDIETYDENRKFYCASISTPENNFHTFYDKESLANFFKTPRFRNSYVAATHLSFDFLGLFFEREEMKKIFLLWRGSNLLYAKTYIDKGKFTLEPGQINKLIFIDTMNYASMSVQKWGKLLKLPKLVKPEFLGKYPKTRDEVYQMELYNQRDAEISKKALEFLYKGFQGMGGTPKTTIASTSMRLFTNKYLKNTYYPHREYVLRNQFQGYYGGRTEAFCRGKIENYNYYDVNSLYPYVMLNEFPNPNSLKTINRDTAKYIDSYHGMSLVDIAVPESDYPVLPYRTEDKLLFPYGEITKRWHTHIELRKAIEEGAVLKRVHKTYYYTETCRPFHDFITDMYQKRKDYERQGQPDMALMAKIIMNSFYGKLGQRFIGRDNIVHMDTITKEQIDKLKTWETLGEYIRTKKDCRPANFCFPVWSSYVTAYGRLHLHSLIKRAMPVYADTDSIITKKEFAAGSELGQLKLVSKIKDGLIVKPKFYAIDEEIKAKGIGIKLSKEMFDALIQNGYITYTKFAKFREALRRGFLPNQVIPCLKQISLEDDKRIWEDSFSLTELQHSRPVQIIDGLPQKKYRELWQKAEDQRKTYMEKALQADIDWNAKGKDISKEEFIENEFFT